MNFARFVLLFLGQEALALATFFPNIYRLTYDLRIGDG